MNIPNKLTIMRILLVPFIMFFVIYEGLFPAPYGRAAAALLFLITALTDLIDGKIARKYGMITDFGKFMDPIADKFMVIGTLLAITASYEAFSRLYIWVTAIVVFRELAVTSIRLVVSSRDSIVISASWLGKCKTVSQSVCILVVMLEEILLPFSFFKAWHPLSLTATAVMVLMTVWSGIDYSKTYIKYLDPTK